MHLGSLESTQEARVALGYRLVQLLRIFRALQTSRVHQQLDIRTLSMNKFLIRNWFHAVKTFVEETQMVQISKNEAFVVLASSKQLKLKEQFCN